MEKERTHWKKWLYWLSLVAVAIFLYKVLDNFGDIMNSVGNFFKIITPFLIGILISYILYMPCKKVEELLIKTKKGIIYRKARPISVILVYIIALILIIILMTFILPPVIESVVDLTNNFQNYYNVVTSQINALPEDSFWKTTVIQNIMDAVKNFDLTQFINVEAISQRSNGFCKWYN